jgi:hypothetical protein
MARPVSHPKKPPAILARLAGCAIASALCASTPAAGEKPPTVPVKLQRAFAECVPTPERYLDLDWRNFDQGIDAAGNKWGWREVADKKGCETAAADLIATWSARHAARLAPQTQHFMKFHEGQVRAMGGDYVRAAELIEAGRAAWPTPEGEAYVDAILAFLRQDRSGLLAARKRMMAVPAPADWTKTQQLYLEQTGSKPAWPINIEAVDKMIACFGKGYTGGADGDCEWRPSRTPGT